MERMKTRRFKYPSLFILVLFISMMLVITPTFAGPTAPPQDYPVQSEWAPASDFSFNASKGWITDYRGAGGTVIIPRQIGSTVVVGIDDYAFEFNDDVTAIYVPETVTYLGWCVFDMTDNLKQIAFYGSPPWDCDFMSIFPYQDLTIYCKKVYLNDYKDFLDYAGASRGTVLKQLETEEPPVPTETYTFNLLPNGTYEVTGYSAEGTDWTTIVPAEYNGQPVTKIASGAFSGKRLLKSVEIPGSITEIGDEAFYNCTSLETLIFHEGLETIGRMAFQYCNSLTEVSIPASVLNMTVEAFPMCSNLETITVAVGNPNFADIDGVLFTKDLKRLITYPSGRPDTVYDIPEGTEVIGETAFKLYYEDTYSKALEEVRYPDSLIKIEDLAFMQSSIKKVTIIPGVEMGRYVFEYAKNLRIVEIKEGVTELSEGLFYAIDNCEVFILPSTLKVIGDSALERLPVETLVLPDGLETIGADAFYGSKIKTLYIPASVKNVGLRAFAYMPNLESIVFDSASTIEEMGNYALASNENLTNVVLPTTLKRLNEGTFGWCYSLEDIDLPDSLEYIGYRAFTYCVALEEIDIPDNVTEIGNSVFYRCYSLKSVQLPASLDLMGYLVFEECFELEEVIFPSSMTLGTLPYGTFYSCYELRKLYLPDSILGSEELAFALCYSLSEVNVCKNFERNYFDTYSTYASEGNYYLDVDGVPHITRYWHPDYQMWIEGVDIPIYPTCSPVFIYRTGAGLPGSGDLNGDGVVTMGEALTVMRLVAGLGISLTPAQLAAADINLDGAVTMTDVLLIMRKAAEL